MKKKLTIIFIILAILFCVPSQTEAGAIKDKLSSAISKIHDKVDSAVSKLKEKVNSKKTAQAAASESDSSDSESESPNQKTSVKTKISNAFSSALSKARSTLQGAFNMNFLSSVPVIFWKKSFDKMFEYSQKSVDNMNLEYNGELITRDDFQDDKALHIKKSAELALHIKSLFGSSVVAYGLTLAVGGIKELIDSSFLNPNGGRCWEDFYADMVGASAVFGEKAFDKKLNKYMDSFLKENRTIDKINNEENDDYENIQYSESIDEETSYELTEETIDSKKEETDTIEEDYNTNTEVENTEEFSNKVQTKQALTKAYYEAVQRGDKEAVKAISEQLKSLQ